MTGADGGRVKSCEGVERDVRGGDEDSGVEGALGEQVFYSATSTRPRRSISPLRPRQNLTLKVFFQRTPLITLPTRSNRTHQIHPLPNVMEERRRLVVHITGGFTNGAYFASIKFFAFHGLFCF